MSKNNVQVIKGLYERINSRDIDSMLGDLTSGRLATIADKPIGLPRTQSPALFGD
jgi:hypothetical protein